jgi:tetratricopeptide (TPR) repeat protein
MAEKETLNVDVMQAIDRAEKYFEENKKSLTIIIGALVVLVGSYFAWTYLYIAPMEEEARSKMFMAEKYFEQDSLDKAINGFGVYKGFKEIANQYGLTRSGNLAHFYLGICYLHKGQFEEAIKELKQYDGDDAIVSSIAIGAQGDAYSELGKYDEAIDLYLKAADYSENDFSTPIYLMKAAQLYEVLSDYKKALRIYERLKTEYPETREGRDIEKYISRARIRAGIE